MKNAPGRGASGLGPGPDRREPGPAPGTWAIAAAFVGTVVGAGFASGQETLQFFTAYGRWGLAGLVLAMALFAGFGVRVLLLGRRLKAASHRPVIQWAVGPRLAPAVDGLMIIFLLGTAATMVSGAAATMVEQFGWPRWLGALLMAAASTVTVLTGLRGVVGALALFAPVLIASVLAIAGYSLATGPGLAGALAWQGAAELAPVPAWWLGAGLYVAYNMVLAIPILAPLGAAARDRDSVAGGGVLGGVLLGLGAAAIHLTVASFMPAAGTLDIPMLFAARTLPPGVSFAYSVLLLAEVYTTAVAMLFGVAARFGETGGMRFRASVLAGGAAVLAGGLFPFAQVVGTLYPVIGILGGVLLLAFLRPAAGGPGPPGATAAAVMAGLAFTGILAAAPAAGARADLDAILAAMSLEEKVGQLFMVHAYGAAVDAGDPVIAARNRELHGVDSWRELLQRYPVGGVIYFNYTDNIVDPAQVAALSNDLQRLALSWRVPVPLLVAIDQEGGVVQRVGEPATEFPGNMALAAAGDVGLAYQAARVIGTELRAMGINVNFAPVADVNVNPANPIIGVRSFGDRAKAAGEYVAAQVKGYRDAGVAAAAKHFPGHGNTDVDSHLGLPRIPHGREEVEAIDLPPFQAAIAAGVDMIMTAHIVVPSLDPSDRPATLSEPILTGLLRDKLGFAGVIVTDALNMAGARQTFDPGRTAVEALRAGVDILLMPPDLEEAYEAVLQAVRNGELSEERIDASVLRILQLKERLGLFAELLVDPAQVPATVGKPEHKGLAARIALDSVTVVKNASGRLPLRVGEVQRVLVTGWGQATTAGLAAALAEEMDVRVLATGPAPSEAAIRAAAETARAVDLVIAVTANAYIRPEQQALVRELLATGTPVIVVAVGMPYDIAAFPEVDTYVALYGYGAVSLRALAAVLMGRAAPRGRLPVDIPQPGRPGELLYPAGHGLSF